MVACSLAPFLAQRHDRHTIPAFCPITGAGAGDIGGVFQILSQCGFKLPRAMAMNDAQKRRASQGCAIQRRNHVIQRFVRRLPSNIHDRLFIEPQRAA